MRTLRARLLTATTLSTLAVVVVAAVLAELHATDDVARVAMRELLVLMLVLGLGASLFFSLVLSRRLTEPLEVLHRTAQSLAEGQLEARARAWRSDELGAVGRALDGMADAFVARLAAVDAERARLRVMLDAMAEAVLVTDPEGRVVLSNAAFVGLAGGAGIGRTAVETVRSAELHDAVLQALAGQKARATFEFAIAGEPRIVSAQAAPLPARSGAIVVMRDVTEVRRLDAVRRDFVANASHELRTPLTAIRGFAETLRDGALEHPDIAQRFVENIHDNALRLSRLVDDLLALSRSESPDARLELGPVDARAVARRVFTALEGEAAARSVMLVLAEDGPADVVADADALDQVLLNLVDNAIKHTPSRGRVEVRFRADGDARVIEVADTGVGIPAQHLPRIFERFYRVDAGRSRARGGTGLGLSIVKHLTTRMNGDVSVESRVDQGTTFRVRLGGLLDGTRMQLSSAP